MTNKKRSLKKYLFSNWRIVVVSSLFNWFKRQYIGIKIILVFAFFILLLFISRFNLFGNLCYKFSKSIIPFEIPLIDTPKLQLLVEFNFEVLGSMGKIQGKLGRTYYTGDQLYLEIKTNLNCWLTVFCIDANGIKKVEPWNFDPFFVKENQLNRTFFILDNTVGNEIYYAIASLKKFNFKKDIKRLYRMRESEFS